MYASVRVYRARPESLVELNRLVNEEFVPLVSKLPGYVAYFGVDQGDGKWASFSVFQTGEAAAASNRTAAEWVRRRVQQLIKIGPDTTTGFIVAAGPGQEDLLAEQPAHPR